MHHGHSGRRLLVPVPMLIGLLATASPAPDVAGPDPGAAVPAAVVSSPPDLGHDRIGVRRGDTWFLRDALDAGPSRRFRESPAGWAPLAGDFDRDGRAGTGLFSAGTFRLREVEGGPVRAFRFGQRGDVPVAGDFDGDGVDTVGVFRAGQWWLRASTNPSVTARRMFVFGRAGDVPVVGDWDGDGDDDIAVRRGSQWFQRDAASPGPSSRTFSYGLPGDVPVSGDWDHDGRDTPGVFRAGTWFLRRGSAGGSTQTVRYGTAGDRPVVRRSRGLAPGVQHRVLREPAGPWVAHVASIDLAAASSLDPVLSQNRLRDTELLSSMTRRAGAVLGINGDFALANGRPLHVHAEDGRLLQSALLPGRALMLDAPGRRATLGSPDVRVGVTSRPGTAAARAAGVLRVNAGPPTGRQLAAYSAEGNLLESPLDGQCYALLRPTGRPVPQPGGTIATPSRAGRPRCGGPRPALPPSGTLLAAQPTGPGATFLRGLAADTPVTTTALLGAPGAFDVLGGGSMLLVGGAIAAQEVDGAGSFFRRHPRTAVGATADGRLLLVVVDGRQPGYSRGMTLRELADLMRRLGARSAMNLDGGGSAAMVVNGLVASRPSEGRERPVANALVVLPGADRGTPQVAAVPAPLTALSSQRGHGDTDAGSTGGLADALQRSGVPLPPDLRRSVQLLRSAPPGPQG